MKIQFYKYEGTGNDFVMIDNRNNELKRDQQDLFENLCDRKFGIGADGLILLQNKEGYDFEMVYFNADGRESSMCGNGGRCIVAFAKQLEIIQESCRFLAIDGDHEATIDAQNHVKLKMQDIEEIEVNEKYFWLDTGSPHYVQYVDDVAFIDVAKEGAAIRYSQRFEGEGTNVNFVEVETDHLLVRTYERGVEDETLSCGTGVTAVALVHAQTSGARSPIQIRTLGGDLEIYFSRLPHGYENIHLAGPARFVFEGLITI